MTKTGSASTKHSQRDHNDVRQFANARSGVDVGKDANIWCQFASASLSSLVVSCSLGARDYVVRTLCPLEGFLLNQGV
jgi:hypothetical protein